MGDAVEKVLLIPRFTSFAGSGPFYTAPMNVRAYRQALFTGWSGQGIGPDTPSSVGIGVQQSTDLGTWADTATLGFLHDDEETAAVDLTMEWMRLAIGVSGTHPAITLWLVGNFVLREE